MGKCYIGDSGAVARAVKKMYVGDANDIARKVKKAYIGDANNIAQLIFSAGQPLSNLSAGDLVKINETVSGTTTAIPYLVLGHSHHDADGTTLVRNKLFDTTKKYHASTVNTYNGSDIDVWLVNTYYGYLDAAIQDELINASIAAAGSSISRKVFLLSGTEVGFSDANMYTEGSAIAYFNSNSRRTAYLGAGTKEWLLRSAKSDVSTHIWVVNGDAGANDGTKIALLASSFALGVRPVLVLPKTTNVSAEVDGDNCYNIC